MLNTIKNKNKKNLGTKCLGNLAYCEKTKTMNNKNRGTKRNPEKRNRKYFQQKP